MSKSSRPASPLCPDPSAFALKESDYASIDRLVRYTFSNENQTRLSLLKRVGTEALARIEKHIGPEYKGEDRAGRYDDLARAYTSKAFLASQSREAAVGVPLAARTDASAAAQTPTSNTGVTPQDSTPLPTIQLVVGTGKKSKILEVPARCGHNGQAAIVDWLHVTIGKETTDSYIDYVGGEDFLRTSFIHASLDHFSEKERASQDDHERILALSYRLERIFGYGVTLKRKSGRDFYRDSYMLGKPEEEWGYVCIGGQNETILIGITGTGCAAAKEGWERRLYDFLCLEAERPKITRIDLAHDDYMGERYTPDTAFADYKSGLFQCYKGTAPTVETIGSDWHCPRGKGRTLAVGLRASGKYCRVYERGMKLGCKESPWTRIEVEFKGTDRVLPFDMLLDCGKYLAGAYPALNWISETQERIQTEKKQAVITYDKALEVVQHQYGHYLKFMLQVEGSADNVLQKIMRDGNPRRLQDRDYRCSPDPIRLDRHSGLSSQEVNSLLDAHMAGVHIPACFFGHSQISDNSSTVN